MSKVTPEFLAVLKSKPIGPDVMALIEEVEHGREEAIHIREEIEDHEASFELRWKADMRAIEQWQEAHPGNDHIWPDHADLCMWLIGEVDRLSKEVTRLRADLQLQAVLTGGPQEALDNALKEINRLKEIVLPFAEVGRQGYRVLLQGGGTFTLPGEWLNWCIKAAVFMGMK